MGNIICAKFCTDNVTHIKISNKLTPSINYFLILLSVCEFWLDKEVGFGGRGIIKGGLLYQ